MGFVTSPLNVSDNREDFDVAVFAAQGSRANHLLLERARAEQWILLRLFENRGKKVGIFQRR
ncbi:hypothetical protein N9H39_03975 [Gammaproteobacteria bacterium]|nr:hypothetical protein [Gammaproteobacteria bacterium]